MPDWIRTLIRPDTTIREAMARMEDHELRIALVTDEKRVLKGVVTDGDIRRGILNGVSLEDPVTAVMSSDPTVAHAYSDRNAVLALMREKHLLHVPIVDDEGRVVGLEIIDYIWRCFHSLLQVVKPEEDGSGFDPLPWHWVIERTFGWFGGYRRLIRDYEHLPEMSEAMVRAAMIRLMIRRVT